jgi:hypothetical protein
MRNLPDTVSVGAERGMLGDEPTITSHRVDAQVLPGRDLWGERSPRKSKL